jgi:hypothetical protein
MLADKPVSAAAVGEAESLVALKYTIKLAMVDHDHRFFALNSSNNNNFVYHLFDVVSFVSIFVIALTL